MWSSRGPGKYVRVVGVLILFAEPELKGDRFEPRIGYLLSETTWGQGMATNLLTGLVERSRQRPRIAALVGGVDAENTASRRVLEKAGFRVAGSSAGDVMYRLRV